MCEYVDSDILIPSSLRGDLEKLGELLDASNAAIELGKQVFARVGQQRDGTEFRSELECVAYVLLGKSFKTLNSVQILCRTGCGADAMAQCGSLLENLVDLTYMHQDSARAINFIAYEQVDKYYQAKKILRRSDITPEDRERYDGYLDTLAAQVQQHLDMFPIQSCWSKPVQGGSKYRRISLRDRAEETGFGAEYDKMYYIFCGFKHTVASASSGFMFRHEQGVDVILGPNVNGVYNAALPSARYFLDICRVFQSVFNLTIESEIDAIAQQLSAAGRNVLNAHPDLCE